MGNINKKAYAGGLEERPRKRVKPAHHARDVFHAWMVDGAEFAGPLDMPVLAPVHVDPDRIVALSDIMRPGRSDFDCFGHAFEDDDILGRFWNNPKAYVRKIGLLQGMLGLDFSVSYDFPVPLKEYNYWRNNAATYWLQQQGIAAVPQARCEPDNCEAVLAGHPRHSTIAIGARSMVRRIDDRAVLKASVECIVDILEPYNVLWYGSDLYGVTDYPRSKGIPVHVYPAKGRGELDHHIGDGD